MTQYHISKLNYFNRYIFCGLKAIYCTHWNPAQVVFHMGVGYLIQKEKHTDSGFESEGEHSMLPTRCYLFLPVSQLHNWLHPFEFPQELTGSYHTALVFIIAGLQKHLGQIHNYREWGLRLFRAIGYWIWVPEMWRLNKLERSN